MYHEYILLLYKPPNHYVVATYKCSICGVYKDKGFSGRNYYYIPSNGGDLDREYTCSEILMQQIMK